jgi:RNA ligase partner protein
MEKYILDTNLFFNMEPGLGIGKKTEEVVVKATQAMKRLKTAQRAEFFMPPRVVNEFLSFFEDKEQAFLKAFLAEVTVKSPDLHKIQFPAEVFYKIVEDVRGRSYRGLTIGEEELKKVASQLMGGAKLQGKEFELKIGKFIKTLRDRYRQATRFGFLDSLADLDVIALAKELDAYLVSTDEGVINWGRIFGVKEMAAEVFGQKLQA